jgi:arylsulfatase A-like enzyme
VTGHYGRRSLTVASVRVPLYDVSWPGHIHPGTCSNLVARLDPDLAPTLLGLADVPSDNVLDGRNMFGPDARGC